MEGEMKKTALMFMILALGIQGFHCAFASQITGKEGRLNCFTFCIELAPLPAFASAKNQGEYAIRLAEKLGMGENLSADAALAALTKVGIMQADGFKPGDPMNPVIR